MTSRVRLDMNNADWSVFESADKPENKVPLKGYYELKHCKESVAVATFCRVDVWNILDELRPTFRYDNAHTEWCVVDRTEVVRTRHNRHVRLRE